MFGIGIPELIILLIIFTPIAGIIIYLYSKKPRVEKELEEFLNEIRIQIEHIRNLTSTKDPITNVKSVGSSERNSAVEFPKNDNSSYIGKHWRGELPLGISFWVNLILLNIGLRLIYMWLTESRPIEHPVTLAQTTILFLILNLGVVYPWQFVGVWRSCNAQERKLTAKKLWPRVVKVVIVLGLIATPANVIVYAPEYKGLIQLGFGEDEYADFYVEVTDDESYVHLRGGLGFGVSEQVAELIEKHPNVRGIILDSIGGRTYEGRELSKLILINSLDTYSLGGCYSACGTAFISGKNRYLGKGANLAFHQYRTSNEARDTEVFLETEQALDLRIFQRQDIDQEFLDRLFKTDSQDLWYPTVDELLNAGVIHGVVNPSDLTPVDYSGEQLDFEQELLKTQLYKTIKQNDPEYFNKMLGSLEEKVAKGASVIEMIDELAPYIQVLLTRALPHSSSAATIKFYSVTVDGLQELNQENPILCIKAMYPDQYGSVNWAKYVSNKTQADMSNAVNAILSESYKGITQELDKPMADETLEKLLLLLGEEAAYLEPSRLQSKSDYSRTCNASIKLFQHLLNEEEEIAANALRYLYSEE